MKQILVILMVSISYISVGQTFHKTGPDIYFYGSTVNQTKVASYIYLKDEADFSKIKNDIYRFFDAQISLKREDFKPNIDITTTYIFYIYKRTNDLNQNFVFDKNANPDNNPMIHNHNSDIIAIVTYERIGSSKSIDFYADKKIQKLYRGDTEKRVTDSYRELVGDLE